MSGQDKEKWLDELISGSIDTTKPEFDAEQWKKKHPDALQSLLARRAKPAPSRRPTIWRMMVANPMAPLAAAAAVIIIVSGLLLTRDKQRPNAPTKKPPLVAESPTRIVSMMSLRSTYQRGGWDALEQQLQETLETFGPGPSSVSVQQLLEGSNGL